MLQRSPILVWRPCSILGNQTPSTFILIVANGNDSDSVHHLICYLMAGLGLSRDISSRLAWPSSPLDPPSLPPWPPPDPLSAPTPSACRPCEFICACRLTHVMLYCPFHYFSEGPMLVAARSDDIEVRITNSSWWMLKSHHSISNDDCSVHLAIIRCPDSVKCVLNDGGYEYHQLRIL